MSDRLWHDLPPYVRLAACHGGRLRTIELLGHRILAMTLRHTDVSPAHRHAPGKRARTPCSSFWLSGPAGGGEEVRAQSQQLGDVLKCPCGRQDGRATLWGLEAYREIQEGERDAFEADQVNLIEPGSAYLVSKLVRAMAISAKDAPGNSGFKTPVSSTTASWSWIVAYLRPSWWTTSPSNRGAHREIAATKTGPPGRTTRRASRNAAMRSRRAWRW
jgi:hypothetical protein